MSRVPLACYVYSLRPPDDGFGSGLTTDQVIGDLHRRDTGPLGQAQYGDPSAKIWGLYLSLAEKFDKEHGDSWAGNTDGVLVFVRVHPPLFSNRVCTQLEADRSFLRDGGHFYRSELPKLAAQLQ